MGIFVWLFGCWEFFRCCSVVGRDGFIVGGKKWGVFEMDGVGR